jgi:hypothetical protein
MLTRRRVRRGWIAHHGIQLGLELSYLGRKLLNLLCRGIGGRLSLLQIRALRVVIEPKDPDGPQHDDDKQRFHFCLDGDARPFPPIIAKTVVTSIKKILFGTRRDKAKPPLQFAPERRFKGVIRLRANA